MNTPLMKCGCAVNGKSMVNGVMITSCVIHGCTEPADPPNLEGRLAKCSYGCAKPVKSSTDLAFFNYQPTQEFDRYYCGCYGWN